jgi:hypothetical protein
MIVDLDVRSYFAKRMNEIRLSEGHEPYDPAAITSCWETMHEQERSEWRDEYRRSLSD